MSDLILKLKEERKHWDKLARFAVDECIAIAEQHNAWINVNERLPPIDKDVLVYVSDGLCGAYVDISHYKGDDCLALWHGIYRNETVSFWHELPLPPIK